MRVPPSRVDEQLEFGSAGAVSSAAALRSLGPRQPPRAPDVDELGHDHALARDQALHHLALPPTAGDRILEILSGRAPVKGEPQRLILRVHTSRDDAPASAFTTWARPWCGSPGERDALFTITGVVRLTTLGVALSWSFLGKAALFTRCGLRCGVNVAAWGSTWCCPA